MSSSRCRITLFALLMMTLIAATVAAQSTTATIRGKIVNDGGNSIPNAEINAVDSSSGFVHTVHSRSDGSFTLGGLTPGLYNIVVAATGYDPKNQDIQVLVGQNLEMDLRLSPTQTVIDSDKV